MGMERTKKPAWRKWLKRIAWGLLVLVGLLVLFHRPIIFQTARYFVAKAAKEQHLDIQYDLGGTIFSSLSISNLHAKPTAPGPIEKLDVGQVNVRYSLMGLMRHGLADLLDEIDLRDVTVVMNPALAPPPKKEEKKSGGGGIPPLMPKRLNIVNVNFVSHAPEGDTEVNDFDFQLDPDKPGALKLKTLNVPGVRRWSDISAEATYHDRNLILTNLSAGPEIQFKRLNLDGSRLEQNEVALALEGTLLGSALTLDARLSQFDKAKHLNAHASVANLNFDEVWKYLNLAQSLHGSVEKLEANFEGGLQRPVEWTGKIEAGLRGLALDRQALGDVTATVVMQNGRAQVALTDQVDEKNQLGLQAESALPEKMDGFKTTAAKGTLILKAPDLDALLKPMGIAVVGDVAANIPFQWEKGNLTADVSLDSKRLATPDLEVKQAAIAIHAEKDFNAAGESILNKLETRTQGTVGALRFKDYEAESVKLSVTNHNADAKVEELSLLKGKNVLHLQARSTIPADFKSWQDMPVHVSLNLDAPELQAFVAPGSSLKLAGSAKVNGEAAIQQGKYSGGFQIEARDLRADELTVQSVDGAIKIADGKAQISRLDAVVDAKNRLSVSGEAGLAAPFTYNLSLDLGLTDLSSFQPLLKNSGNDKVLGGSLVTKWHGSGEVQSAQHSGEGTLALTGGRFGDQQNLEASLSASYTPEKVDVTALRASANKAEAKLSAHWDKKRLQIRDIALRLQQTPLLQGSVDLPLDAANLKDVARAVPDDQPIKISLKSNEVDLKRLLQQLGQKEPPISGSAELGVNAEGTLRNLLAKVSVRSWQLRAKAAPDLAPAGVTLDFQVKNKRLTIDGSVTQPLVQAMKLSGDVPLDLSQLKTPAQILPPDQPLRFSFDSGEVDLKKLLHQLGQKDPALSGNGRVSIDLNGPLNGLAADLAVHGAKLQAKSAPGMAPADVALDLKLRDKRLTVDGNITQPLVQAMKLTGDLPVDLSQLKDPDRIVPSDQALKISFQSGDVDLKKLLLQLGQKEPPMTGKAQVNVEASGTLADLAANVSVRGTGLQAPKAAKVAPAELALDVSLKDRRLKLNGSVRQALIQPLEIKGDVPLDIDAVRKTKTLDPKTPLNLEVTLPKSSVAFVSSLVPAIRFIKGTAAIDVKIKGTVAAPDFGGTIASDLDNLRFVDPGLPPLNNAVLRINFTRDQVTINQFTSGSAGGTLGASGTVKFAKITEPVFDLKIVSNKALVKQDDNITARVSADVKIVGPLNAGTVSGTVFITKSHFFKDIDILPIGLPGRPAPQPQPDAGPTVVSFPDPPLRDWKFDVAIKTSDPFLIQGNLADGKVTSDLHFGGTGLKPWLDGSARITHLTTSLPFSKLEISAGMVYFTQDAPFVPKLNIRGTSTIRDYNISVSIYGTASAPQAVFSSEPPLPQSDVVALLATGTTTKELSGDPNALAGRAAYLVIQKYYHKWFGKKNEPAKQDNSLLGSAQFDFGAVDPKTGKQSLAVRLPMGDHYAISGGLDVGGDFRGEVKYIMRFR